MRRVFFPAAVLVLFASCVSTDAAVNQLREVVRRAEDSGPTTAALVATLQQLIQSILASETP
jgi:hypothetical protein